MLGVKLIFIRSCNLVFLPITAQLEGPAIYFAFITHLYLAGQI